MMSVINKNLKKEIFDDVLDIGTTNDMEFPSSNYLVRNLEKIKKYKSISDQKINSDFFSSTLKKSITDDFSLKEINLYSADLVISNATIEHVGSYSNQIKMISNIINFSKKKFIISTPNRFHPIDFHTKIPFIHWLPKKIHRKILSLIGLDYYAKEENLNLLSLNNLMVLLDNFNNIKYKIFRIRLFGFVSNFILIGIVKK
jgi:hypothetical protein